MLKTLLNIASLVLAVVVAAPAQAAPTFYNSRATFLSQLGASVTDDYSNPGYVFNQNNAVMSAVLGETDYFSTGFPNVNIVSGATYCAGCNGSFRLDFTSTTVGGANGVFGAGVDILLNAGYFASIIYGDNTTDNIDLVPFGALGGFDRLQLGGLFGGQPGQVLEFGAVGTELRQEPRRRSRNRAQVVQVPRSVVRVVARKQHA